MFPQEKAHKRLFFLNGLEMYLIGEGGRILFSFHYMVLGLHTGMVFPSVR